MQRNIDFQEIRYRLNKNNLHENTLPIVQLRRKRKKRVMQHIAERESCESRNLAGSSPAGLGVGSAAGGEEPE